jgi:hypothetical protein
LRVVVLFRFHRDLSACQDRVRILRHFNPGHAIHGIFGGAASDFAEAQRVVGPLLDGLFLTRSEDSRWKWLHPDLALKEWFRDWGHRLSFDFLIDHEWDLLFTAPLLDVYPRPSSTAVALSGRESMEMVKDSWWWCTSEPQATCFRSYLAFMRSRYGIAEQLWASLGPGPMFPRAFVEKFSAADHPKEIFAEVISEVVYPGFAQALGFEVHDTGFHPGWSSEAGTWEARRVFNCDDVPVSMRTIAHALKRGGERRVFHPVKYDVRIEDLQRLMGEPQVRHLT